MSDFTPTDDEVMEAWAAHSSPDLPTVSDLVSAYDTFRRWLAEHDAKVRAEALREAAEGLRAGIRGSKCNPACHVADQITLRMRADGIESKAGLT